MLNNILGYSLILFLSISTVVFSSLGVHYKKASKSKSEVLDRKVKNAHKEALKAEETHRKIT